MRLTLVKIKDYPDYTRYQIVKVDDDGNETPLYCESFTPDQVEDFYKPPTRIGRWRKCRSFE